MNNNYNAVLRPENPARINAHRRARKSTDPFYENEVRITKPCMLCGKLSTVAFPKDYYENGMRMRENGALVQVAFPISSPEVREFLISGMCLDCQDMMFGSDDEDEFEGDFEDEEILKELEDFDTEHEYF